MTAPRASASGIRRPASGIIIDAGQLTRLRKDKYWERDDLARETGLSSSMIRKLETGERRARLSTLKALCDALGCAPGDLVPEMRTEENDER